MLFDVFERNILKSTVLFHKGKIIDSFKFIRKIDITRNPTEIRAKTKVTKYSSRSFLRSRRYLKSAGRMNNPLDAKTSRTYKLVLT